jgi:hypothetical protein
VFVKISYENKVVFVLDNAEVDVLFV